MPIYAYKCASCGHAKDVLQKISDAPLTSCPACGAESFTKQITAAGFQLKGSGWYVTDFRGGNNGKPATDSKASETAATDAKPADAGSDKKSAETQPSSETKPSESGSAKSDAPSASAGVRGSSSAPR
jgi:putative FmdB family regulatory protein